MVITIAHGVIVKGVATKVGVIVTRFTITHTTVTITCARYSNSWAILHFSASAHGDRVFGTMGAL